MLWKKKVLIGTVWVLGSIVAAAVVWKLPPVYKSEALILVDSQKIPERFVSSTVSTDIQDRIATISQEILSSTRLKKIIDDFGLYKSMRSNSTEEEILDTMRKDILVTNEKGWTGNRPGAFRVAYQGPDPQVVAQVANRLANLYIEENLRVREVQAEGTTEFMDTQLAEAKKRLDQLEASVSEYKRQHIGELPQQENSISAELTRMNLALQSNRDDIRRAQETINTLQSTLTIAESTVSALSQAAQAAQQPAVAPAGPAQIASTPSEIAQPLSQVQKKVQVLRARLEALHDLGYADRHPDVIVTKQALASALIDEAKETKDGKAASSQEKTAATPSSPKQDASPTSAKARAKTPEPQLLMAQERVVTIKGQIASLEQDIKDRTADQKKILDNINLLQSRLTGLPVREQEMAALTRDYEISKGNYRVLLDKKLSAEMATDMERRQKSERFALLDPPRVPEKPIKPNRPLFGGLGSAGALALGLLLGVGFEMRKNSVLGEWELPAGVVVLGRIPYIEAGSIRSSSQRPRLWRRFAFGLASLFLVAMLATGLYYVRSRF
jgi:polysaccharide chain length determinant protein (PEP-CTERM system associated)